jgi:hypothetical protein
MIPENHKEDIIQSGINFMRSITDAYGTDDGMKLWDNIASVLDPDIKGQIFFALLTGDYKGIITITGCVATSNRVAMVKAIRTVTGWGLKESKDALDLMLEGKPQQLTVNPKHRHVAMRELRDAGFYV